MRFAAAAARLLVAAAIGVGCCGGAARAQTCPPLAPEDAARVQALEDACAKKGEHETCVRVSDKNGCPISAVVATAPDAAKGPWEHKMLAHGIGLIACRYPQTWVHVEPARGYQWQRPRACDLAGMRFRFQPAGVANPSRPPETGAARAPRG